MLGKNPTPTKPTALGLIKGIIALDITLLPWDSSTTFSTTCVCKPVLRKSVLVVWILLSKVERTSIFPEFRWVLKVPTTLDETTPLHWVSHEFQIVPSAFWFAANTAL